MKRASKRIILTSERVNNYGFRVLTDGIDLSQYDKNPVMLWMHKRPLGNLEDQCLPIGNVIELKREVDPVLGKVITGLPVFDDTDDFAMKLFGKYENGTIRMASSGLMPIEWSAEPEHLIDGQRGPTLILSWLQEVSLVDLGGNNDALSVALYDDKGDLIKLSLNGDNTAIIPALKNPFIEMSKIELTAAKAAVLLGLSEITSADQFETKIMEVVQLAHRQKTEIQTLTSERDGLQTKLDNLDKEQLKTDTNVMLTAAKDARKITADEFPFFEGQITDRASFDRVKLYLDAKGGNASVKTVVEAGDKGKVDLYAGKTYDDLDRTPGALVKLKADNPNLFNELYKAKFGKEYGAK